MPELCGIQCRGKADSGWGAIAYSKPDQVSGWSYEKSDKPTAERWRSIVRQTGGAKCIVEPASAALRRRGCGWQRGVVWGEATKIGAQQRAMTECGKGGGKKCDVEAVRLLNAGASSAPPTAPAAKARKATSWGAIAYSSRIWAPDGRRARTIRPAPKKRPSRSASSAARPASCRLPSTNSAERSPRIAITQASRRPQINARPCRRPWTTARRTAAPAASCILCSARCEAANSRLFHRCQAVGRGAVFGARRVFVNFQILDEVHAILLR